MNKKILLLAALINMIPVLQVAAMSVENIYEEYSFWLEDFSEMCEGGLKEITLADSFANKQIMWYLIDGALWRTKMDLNEHISYVLTEENYPNYDLNIEIYKNKINFIKNAFAQLDDVVSLIEEQFSIPMGQFKIRAIEFAESQDLFSFAESFVPLSNDSDV